MHHQRARGFAIIELLVVLGVLALLFVGVLYVTSRAQTNTSGNTQRHADVNAILHAVEQYQGKHNGQMPDGVTSTAKLIASTPGSVAVNLCSVLVPDFMDTIPLDPSAGLAVPVGAKCNDKNVRYNSGYTIMAEGSHVTVSAPAADSGETIFASN